MENSVIVIVGPTGVGKTETSIKIAKEFDGEIVSADSMQIYKKMDIGTAKITKDETDGVPHHMIDILDIDKTYSAAAYKKDATRIIDDIIKRGKTPVVAGGTGLYVDSLFSDFEFGASFKDEKIREKYNQIAKEKGNEYLHALLEKVDKKSAESIHFNNVKRVIRALEIYEMTGKTVSENNSQIKKTSSKYNPIMIGLTRERQKLYDRIDARVDKMIDDGLFKEVLSLYKGDTPFSETALSAIGYKEVIYYIKGLCTFDEMVHILKRESRHYAKRQLTWFKRNKDIKWFDLNDDNICDIINYIKNFKGGILL
ncbi:MAG: tRNA (adenosine(37)-N6)-dimethylallyltransferase MiaA [Ruminococcaceae bacterium]|nr:tRNA (adenosine(37)-N6)-dimethylallyltransferase MiaA [Oscillospiraceae bacterium]